MSEAHITFFQIFTSACWIRKSFLPNVAIIHLPFSKADIISQNKEFYFFFNVLTESLFLCPIRECLHTLLFRTVLILKYIKSNTKE
jgi:hypothetical protein